MLTQDQFTKWLHIRRQSASMACLGRELGVSRQAVFSWLNGTATPSDTVLLLAERISRDPIDLADGLPGDGRRRRS